MSFVEDGAVDNCVVERNVVLGIDRSEMYQVVENFRHRWDCTLSSGLLRAPIGGDAITEHAGSAVEAVPRPSELHPTRIGSTFS